MDQPDATALESPDLVTRLRQHSYDRSNSYRSLTAEAATEIKLLRKALGEIAANRDEHGHLCENICGCQFKAKQALR